MLAVSDTLKRDRKEKCELVVAEANPIIDAAEKRAAYDELLGSSLVGILAKVTEGRPWAAVALAYHHGLSFGPVIGVLPESDYEALRAQDSSSGYVFNPAEWLLYDDDPLFIDDALNTLAAELCKLADESELSGTPFFGREIHVRVTTALRETLLQKQWISETSLVYATDYQMIEFADNAAAANPASAIAARLCE